MEIVAHATAGNPVGATTPIVAARERQVVRSLFRFAAAGMGGVDTNRLKGISNWLRRFEKLPGYEALFRADPN